MQKQFRLFLFLLALSAVTFTACSGDSASAPASSGDTGGDPATTPAIYLNNAAVSGSVEATVGGTVTFTVGVDLQNGATITGVTMDTSGLTGGSASTALLDDGTSGDATSADGTYTAQFTVEAGQAAGTYPLTITTAGASTGTEKTTTVNLVVSAYVPITIVALCADKDDACADGNGEWVDIKIRKASALPVNWSVIGYNYKYVNTGMTEAALSTFTLADGDIIRLHSDQWTGTTDTAKAENNADKYDIKSTDTGWLNDDTYGAIAIVDTTSSIGIDLAMFNTIANTQNYWLENDTNLIANPNNDAKNETDAYITAGLWNENSMTAAYQIIAGSGMQLKTGVENGGTSADWEDIRFALGVATATPADSGVHVANNTTISVTFNQPIDASTVTSSSLYVVAGTDCITGTVTAETSPVASNLDRTYTMTYSANWTAGNTYSTCIATTVESKTGMQFSAIERLEWTAIAEAEATDATAFIVDFEDGSANNAYLNPSVPYFSDAAGDFFTITDGSSGSVGSGYSVTSLPSGTKYLAAMDTNGDGQPLSIDVTIDDINVSGLTSLDFSAYFAEDAAADAKQDWDADSRVTVAYDINNSGTFTNLFCIAPVSAATNQQPAIDDDCDGIGEGPAITSAFAEYAKAIPATGTTLDIKITIANLGDGDEDIAIDNIKIYHAP